VSDNKWVVQLTIKATVYIRAPIEWDDPDGIAGLARGAVNLESPSDDNTEIEVDNIEIDDVVLETPGEEARGEV